MKCQYIIIVLLLLTVVSGCATAPASLEDNVYEAARDDRSVLLESVQYDDFGLPVFTRFLRKTPGKVGDTFTLVRYSKGRPFKSYEVRVAPQDAPDYGRPMKVIYKRSAAGFAIGTTLGLAFLDAITTPEDEEGYSEDVTETAFILAAGSIVVCTVGGFVVGVGESLPQFAEEFDKASMDSKLNVLTYRDYLYDKLGRLITVVEYSPRFDLETKRTHYLYRGDELFPYRMEEVDRWGNVLEEAQYRDEMNP